MRRGRVVPLPFVCAGVRPTREPASPGWQAGVHAGSLFFSRFCSNQRRSTPPPATAVNPDFVIFVMDGSIGQAAFDQAKAFHDSVDVSRALGWRLLRRGAVGGI